MGHFETEHGTMILKACLSHGSVEQVLQWIFINAGSGVGGVKYSTLGPPNTVNRARDSVNHPYTVH